MKKYVILGSLLFVLAAAAAALFLLPPWLAGREWDGAAARLSLKLGRSVQAGSVDFSLFSPLELRELTVSGAEAGDDPLLAIDRLVVDLDPWTIVSGPLVVRDVLVDGPRLRIPVDPGGAPDLGDLPTRLRALLPTPDADDAPAPRPGEAGGEAGGGLLGRVLRATPQLRVLNAQVVFAGPGVATYAALAPGGRLPEGDLRVERGELLVRNTSLLSEDPIYEMTAQADVPALDQHVTLDVRLEWNRRVFEATLGGARPFTWALGDRTLSIGGVSFGSDGGLRIRDLALSQPTAAPSSPASGAAARREGEGDGDGDGGGSGDGTGGSEAGADEVDRAGDRDGEADGDGDRDRDRDGDGDGDGVGDDAQAPADAGAGRPDAAEPASERPFVRIKEIALTLEDAPDDAPPQSGGPFAALAGRISRVDFVEPEIFFSRDPDAGTPISDIEERLYVDELDARLEEELTLDDEPVRAPKPEPAPKGGQRRRIKPEGASVREWVARQFDKLKGSFTSFTDFVHRAGSRLPVRAVRVRRGRFLYEDAARSGSVSRRLYNFFLDAERRMPEQVFTFRMHFETPDADRSKNRIEGRLHLLTRDLHVQFRVDRIELERYRPLLPASFRLSPESVLYDTDVTLTYNSDVDELRAQGRVFMKDFEIFEPGLAAEPLEDMAMGADFEVAVDFAAKALTLSKSRIYLNDVAFSVEGSVEDYGVAPRIRLAFELEKTDAMAIVRSVPRALVPHLAGVQVSGSLALKATVDFDTADLNTLDYRIDTQPVGLAVTDMGPDANLKRLEGTFRHTVQERDGSVTTFLLGPDSPRWVPLGDVSRFVVLALTTTEDGSFFTHRGFSPTQIRRSIIDNLERGYFYRGASTISQQLVKNLFLTRDKTISRKLEEVFITWQMEQRLPKERILELYLNVIEWGPGLYGIRQAAEHYFGKHPSELTLLDTAFLVSIIPNPRRFYAQFERGEVTPRWQDRLRRIIHAMAARGKVSEAEARGCAPYSPYFIGRPQPRGGASGGSGTAPRGARAEAPEPPPPVGVRDNDIPLPDRD
jgi:hypothetical protein